MKDGERERITGINSMATTRISTITSTIMKG
jgi:hypothetical protein